MGDDLKGGAPDRLRHFGDTVPLEQRVAEFVRRMRVIEQLLRFGVRVRGVVLVDTTDKNTLRR
jgi:hypothetical protein